MGRESPQTVTLSVLRILDGSGEGLEILFLGPKPDWERGPHHKLVCWGELLTLQLSYASKGGPKSSGDVGHSLGGGDVEGRGEEFQYGR